jgi:hypothetical protein
MQCQTSLSKKMTCKGTLRQAGLRPLPLLWPHTLPLIHCIHVYSILFHTEKGGGGGKGRELTSEKVRCAMLHKAGRKYQHDCLYLQSINSIKHTFRVCCLYSYFSPRCIIYIEIYNTSHSVPQTTVHSVAHSLSWTLIRTFFVNFKS